MRQEQESTVVDHQRQAASALLLGPVDPAIAGAQPVGGGAKDQHTEPPATANGDGCGGGGVLSPSVKPVFNIYDSYEIGFHEGGVDSQRFDGYNSKQFKRWGTVACECRAGG